MTRTIDVGPIGEVAEGAMKAVEVAGRALLVARVGDRFYAADEHCPHLGGHLSRGTLEGTVVTCPLHGSRFDLADGSVVRWTGASGLALKMAKAIKPPRSLATYLVRIEDGRLLVEIEES